MDKQNCYLNDLLSQLQYDNDKVILLCGIILKV